MAMKYPIGITSFEELRQNNCVYIDKTDTIYELVQNNICTFCRPRGFGKSLLLSTIKAYFEGKKHLFEGLKIMSLEDDWQPRPVFHLDFSNINFHEEGALERTLNAFLSDAEKQYGIVYPDSYVKELMFGIRLVHVFEKAHEQTGHRCVFLVDEYAKPQMDIVGEPHEKSNRTILLTIYGALKAADAHTEFVFMTGENWLPPGSSYNQATDISFFYQVERLCGITEQELQTYLAEPIAQLAQQQNKSTDELQQQLKQLYGGYHFDRKMTDFYNPNSIFKALDSNILADYWMPTDHHSIIAQLLKQERRGIDDILDNDYYDEGLLLGCMSVKVGSYSMLYQCGYLTIQSAREDDWHTYYALGFPNEEVHRAFDSMMKNN